VLRSRLDRNDSRTLAEFIRDELIDEVDDRDDATAYTCELLAETLRSGDLLWWWPPRASRRGLSARLSTSTLEGLASMHLRSATSRTTRTRCSSRGSLRDRPSLPGLPGGIRAEKLWLWIRRRTSMRSGTIKSATPSESYSTMCHSSVANCAGAVREAIRVSGCVAIRGPKVILSLPLNDHWYLTVGPLGGLPVGAGQHAADRLRELGCSVGATYGTLKWSAAGVEGIDGFLAIARDLVRELAAGSNYLSVARPEPDQKARAPQGPPVAEAASGSARSG
jgi:hypothetical protein